MFEKFFILLIITGCIFFIGRRFYRQWRSVAQGKGVPCCTDCCSSCGSSCTDKPAAGTNSENGNKR